MAPKSHRMGAQSHVFNAPTYVIVMIGMLWWKIRQCSRPSSIRYNGAANNSSSCCRPG